MKYPGVYTFLNNILKLYIKVISKQDIYKKNVFGRIFTIFNTFILLGQHNL